MKQQMNPGNEKNGFLDRSTITAMLLVFLIWVGWSYISQKMYPPAPVDPVTQEQVAKAGEQPTNVAAPAAPAPQAAAASAPPSTVQSEAFEQFDDGFWSFQISSKGMGLKNINIKSYSARDNEPIILGDVTMRYPFSTFVAGSVEVLDFKITKTDAQTYVGVAQFQGMTIQKTMKVDSAHYKITTDVLVQNPTADFKGFETVLSDKLVQGSSPSFLVPSYDHQEFFLLHEDKENRSIVTKESGLDLAEKNVTLMALSSHYFAMAIADASPVLPRFEAKVAPNSEKLEGVLTHQAVNKGEAFAIKYTGFAGPKSYGLLNEIDPKLTAVIDYGMFSIIARPLLWLMKSLFSIFGNYGVAIIIMTIIVRFLVLPFNLYSFRSMKVMQKIQPQMQAVREKYKSDPTTMNQEVMRLMRENKANPVGGCLPMLLQLPVFIALYQVLGQSIELYKEPFIFWITDLSVKDEFYVLPILMGITMFVQQKITPTAMDPQQAKIMLWMPVVFSFFMVSLPSGLTLYIFVSTLFGIVQQYIFMREKTPNNTRVKEAKA